MITKNFKNLMSLVFLSASGQNGYLEVKNTSGLTKYLGPMLRGSYFPATITGDFTTYEMFSGIRVGTSDTAPTENDYTLGAMITSGLSAGPATIVRNVDTDGNPYIDYIITFSNSTASDITIREVGYAQTVMCSDTYGNTASGNQVMLLDRTILDAPLTVPANGIAVLKYELKTVIS